MTATTLLRQVEELTDGVILTVLGGCPGEALLRRACFLEQFCRYAKEMN